MKFCICEALKLIFKTSNLIEIIFHKIIYQNTPEQIHYWLSSFFVVIFVQLGLSKGNFSLNV